MSRERANDLDEDFEISIGLSDIEKDDEEIIDALTDVFQTVEIRKPKINLKGKINLKNKQRKKTVKKCHTNSIYSLPFLSMPPSSLHPPIKE